jgi:hypothetical protein
MCRDSEDRLAGGEIFMLSCKSYIHRPLRRLGWYAEEEQ